MKKIWGNIMIKNKQMVFLFVVMMGSLLLGEEKQKSVPAAKSNQYAAIEKKYNIRIIGNEQLSLSQANDKKKECPSLTQEEIQRIAFSFTPQEDVETDVIDDRVIEKLLLLKNARERQFFLDTVFNDHIKTGFGQVQAFLTLSNPTMDLTTIHNRQQAINLLHKDKSLIERVHKELNAIGAAEKKSLVPFQSEKRVLKEDEALPALELPFSESSAYKYLAKIPLARDISLASRGLQPIFGTVMSIKGVLDAKQLLDEKNSQDSNSNYAFMKYLVSSLAMTAGLSFSIDGTDKLKKSLENCSPYRDMLGETKKHMCAINNLSTLISKNEQLLVLLPALQPLADFNDSAKRSNDLNDFISLLNYHDFEGEDSLFSRKGPTLAGKTLLYEVRDELVPVLVAAGKLDMYIALAKLYNGNESREAQYCMPQFVENSPTPLIDARNFWNPYINANSAVTNTITFDHLSPNGIITGPNTGGKSTAMRGLMLNALMAQSFGIASSEKLTMTPFAKMRCLMNTSDDVTNAASFFKAEALNANEILSIAQNLKQNEFGFFTLDEMFSGTSPDAGELATRRFAAKLGNQKNAISLIATHYKNIANLKKNPDSRYTNLQMDLQRNEDGSLKRTYKLKEGESSVNIAFEIIKEAGLDIGTMQEGKEQDEKEEKEESKAQRLKKILMKDV